MPYVENGGIKIWWEEQGTGDPVLLIMGLGWSHEMWFRVTPVLSKSYRVITMDNRGAGRSDTPDAPFVMQDMASDCAAVLDAAGVEQARIMGISLGGGILQQFALSYPERVRALVFCCPIANGEGFVDREPVVTDILLNRGKMEPEEGVRAMIPFTYDEGTPRALIEEDVAMRLAHLTTAAGYYGQLNASAKLNTWDRLSEIAAPTLVLHGATDRLVPPGNGRNIAGQIPGARFELLEACSHIVFTDQHERANALVLDHLGVH